jgi:hypothetical protein
VATTDPAPPSPPGFVPLRLLHRGRQGRVWLAHGPAGPAALEVVDTSAMPPARLAQAEGAARAALCVRHPCLLSALARSAGDGAHCLARELAPGPSLEDLLAGEGPRPSPFDGCAAPPVYPLGLTPHWRVAADWAAQACLALAEAHAHGLVHGAVRPACLFAGGCGELKLGGLGLSGYRRERPGDSLWSHWRCLPYLSPEQVGADGTVYLAGNTISTDLPVTAGAYQTGLDGPGFHLSYVQNAFFTHLNASGSALLGSTYYGLTQPVTGEAVAVDGGGNAYVAGTWTPTVGPTIPYAYAAKFDPTFSTRSWEADVGDGATGDDTHGHAVALAADGTAYLAGDTIDPALTGRAGTAQPVLGGGTDAFVQKVSSAGALTSLTYLGGAGTDKAYGLAVSRSGKVYVTGSTTGSFPTRGGAFQTTYGGGISNAFVAALDGALSTLVYSSYAGGTGTDVGYGVAVDASDRATVVGGTTSSNWPTYQAWQSSNGGPPGSEDGFVARLSATGTLVYSSYLGGFGTDEARGVALDPTGAAYVAGLSNSATLPYASGGYQPTNAGGYDAFVAKVLPRPNAPAITAITTDSGYSASDHVTTYQNLTLSGTSDPSVTVTLSRSGVGDLGSVAANGSGIWTYSYVGTTLSEGT